MAAVLVGIASSTLLEGAEGGGPQALSLVLTVLLIARFAGPRAALGATALVAAFLFYFPAPLSRGAHAPAALHGAVPFGILLLIGLLGIEFSRSLVRAGRRARSAEERAREEARERMAAEEGLVEVAGENMFLEERAGELENGVVPPRALDRQLRVLVVDDNVDAARFLSILLAGQGHVCRTANDGQSAVEMAADFEPEVVFMDIGLPGMDGYEVARRLREQPATRNCLLVALTGYGRDEDRRRSVEAGFDHHLVKPVGYESLEALLASREECLGGQPAG